MADLEALLQRAEREGVISTDQVERLRAMAADSSAGDAPVSPPSRPESPRGFNSVNLAYGVGALLVLFASGWFLIDRWERLGAIGVLTVAVSYAAILAAIAGWLRRNDFPTAAQLCITLAVCLTPIATWSMLSLTGRWPAHGFSSGIPYWTGSWEAWQWILIELSTILVALLVLRWRRIPTLAYPIAFALWGVQYHVARIVRGDSWNAGFDRWTLFTCSAFVLVVAELVERSQARSHDGDGDFAGPFWLVGFAAFAVGYMALWDGAGHWRHLLIAVAIGVLALSLYLRRRVVMAFGMLGVFVYVAWLCFEVFRKLDLFPIVLAALGIAMIVATVWVQRRFPAIVARVDASRGGRSGLPWSPVLPLLLPLIGIVMLAATRAEMAEARAQDDFRLRLELLRGHSHRMLRAQERAKERADARAMRGGVDSVRTPR